MGWIESFRHGDFETTVAVSPGNGKKILLIHGIASTKEIWFLYPILAQDNYYIAYDQRGFGTGISRDNDYHFERYVDDALAIVFKYRPSLIIGHSFGGAIAQKLSAETGIPTVILESGVYPPTEVSGRKLKQAMQMDIRTAIFESLLNYLLTPAAFIMAFKFLQYNPAMPAMGHLDELTDFKDLCIYDAAGNVVKIMGGTRDNIVTKDNVIKVGKCANKNVEFMDVNHAGILYPNFVRQSLRV